MTGDALMRPGGEAHWRNGLRTTLRWKPPRDRPSNTRAERVMTRFDCSRSGCWRCRSTSRAGPPRVEASQREALAEARSLGLRRVEGLYLNALGVMLAMQSDDVGALLVDQQSLVAYRAAGDRRNEAIAHGNIGAGWLGLGELARARGELEEACA